MTDTDDIKPRSPIVLPPLGDGDPRYEELARKQVELKRLRDDFALVKAGWKEALDAKQEAIDELLADMQAHTEHREGLFAGVDPAKAAAREFVDAIPDDVTVTLMPGDGQREVTVKGRGKRAR